MKTFQLFFVLSLILSAPISALADQESSNAIPNPAKGCPFAFNKKMAAQAVQPTTTTTGLGLRAKRGT